MTAARAHWGHALTSGACHTEAPLAYDQVWSIYLSRCSSLAFDASFQLVASCWRCPEVDDMYRHGQASARDHGLAHTMGLLSIKDGVMKERSVWGNIGYWPGPLTPLNGT